MNCWLDAWHVNPSVNRDYDFIDGLRGVAILMVLCCHCIYINPNAGPIIQFLGALCNAAAGGVVLFFAISGFLISWPFWKRKFARNEQAAPPGYAQRRFWKIYPPLALSILILTPVYIILNHDGSYLPLAAKWLMGIPFLLPVSGKLNPVMWTLVIEVQFYITLPLVFIMLKKVSGRVCLWLIPLLFLVGPMIFRAGTGLSPTFNPQINPHYPSGLDAFCLGILMAGLDTHGLLGKKFARLAMGGLVLWPLALVLAAWSHAHAGLESSPMGNKFLWMEEIGSACLLCYVANPTQSVARLLCAPSLRWCGIISYEWYLFHQPMVNWARLLFGPASGNVALYLAIVGGSFLASGILSALIYRCFSLPILKYGRSKK